MGLLVHFASRAGEELGLARFGALVDLRRLVLTISGMRLTDTLALERYLDPAGVEAGLDRHVEGGRS
jgi:hypothetical protein